MEQIIYFKTFLCFPNTLVGGRVRLCTFSASRKTSRKFPQARAVRQKKIRLRGRPISTFFSGWHSFHWMTRTFTVVQSKMSHTVRQSGKTSSVYVSWMSGINRHKWPLQKRRKPTPSRSSLERYGRLELNSYTAHQQQVTSDKYPPSYRLNVNVMLSNITFLWFLLYLIRRS